MEQANAIAGSAQTISRLDVAVSLGLIAHSKVRLLALLTICGIMYALLCTTIVFYKINVTGSVKTLHVSVFYIASHK